MCRLRFAGGMCTSAQLRGVADLAEQYGGGYADCTTRANLADPPDPQPPHARRADGACTTWGSSTRARGADNIRNITGSPTAGIDPQEMIDTRKLCQQMHHYILKHREMYGLPRKFNIAFDGAGTISALEDTNDIGFTAVHVGQGKGIEEGVYFRLTLGGITGHKDFARDTGVLLKPEECVPAAAAIVRAFIEHGDRTDRKKGPPQVRPRPHGLRRLPARGRKALQRQAPCGSRSKSATRARRSTSATTSASTRRSSRASSSSAWCCRLAG